MNNDSKPLYQKIEDILPDSTKKMEEFIGDVVKWSFKIKDDTLKECLDYLKISHNDPTLSKRGKFEIEYSTDESQYEHFVLDGKRVFSFHWKFSIPKVTIYKNYKNRNS